MMLSVHGTSAPENSRPHGTANQNGGVRMNGNFKTTSDKASGQTGKLVLALALLLAALQAAAAQASLL
jgi:hypothetical protein